MSLARILPAQFCLLLVAILGAVVVAKARV